MLNTILNKTPALLVGLRFLIAPYLLWDGLDGAIGIGFLSGFIASFLSDIFDGVLARRLGVSTSRLRQADSWADVCLYVCVAACLWLVYPQVAITFQRPLLAVVLAQLLWLLVNLAKFGKPASYHTYSAKLWGVTLCIATIALFGYGYAGITLWLALLTGILHSLEEILMTLVLPRWQHDVLSIVHALRLRREAVAKCRGDRPFQVNRIDS